MICRGFRGGRSVHGLGGKSSEDSQLPLQRAGYILNLEWQSGCLTLWHERKTMEAYLYAPAQCCQSQASSSQVGSHAPSLAAVEPCRCRCRFGEGGQGSMGKGYCSAIGL